ncbi:MULTISPECIES: lasso peptide biosynthesis B2 protein [unclassified Novosphingobium]|uniref:lasso peptide biosynthesis B2 protein n=1 Tax=unclassified Novosphingobium TaxID=2644732 RepID=UPI001AD1022B|nr:MULTISPECIES: lasso peptide biosynthesis B2 protein [unclassified Novosphingobium]MBN9145675.1 lasso peptide biosynthesis B2 protein [Novosphingobium sp.]
MARGHMPRAIYCRRTGMGYALRAGISFCEVSERLLFLDTVDDRYFCLQPGVEQSFRTMMNDRGQSFTLSHPHDLGGMLRSGVLLETAGPAVPVPFRSGHIARASLLDTPDQQVATGRFLSAMIHIAGARLSLHCGHLDDILTRLDHIKCPWPRSGKVELDPIQSMASAFEATSRFLRSHDKCLSRSLALARCLAAHNLPGDLVIGVKLRPFAAHSWVQSGPWLVNDRIDMIRAYTPIMAV